MSVYLSQPIHYHEAPEMCKYIETIGDLSEGGGITGRPMMTRSGPCGCFMGGHRYLWVGMGHSGI